MAIVTVIARHPPRRDTPTVSLPSGCLPARRAGAADLRGTVVAARVANQGLHVIKVQVGGVNTQPRSRAVGALWILASVPVTTAFAARWVPRVPTTTGAETLQHASAGPRARIPMRRCSGCAGEVR
jgi:hypothetical protein